MKVLKLLKNILNMKIVNFLYNILDKIDNFIYKTEYKYISQRFDWDCGIATTSILKKQPYLKTYKEIKKFKRFNKKLGVSFDSIVDCINLPCEISRKEMLLADFNLKNECILLVFNKKSKFSHYIFTYNNLIYDTEEGRFQINKYKRFSYIRGYISFNITSR